MMTTGLPNTPLINYFFYKQATFISPNADGTCFPILSIADGGNGQLVITTDDTSVLSVGVALTIDATTSYDGNYSVISLTSTTFNVSGIFVGTETGTWELATGIAGANPGDPLDFGKIFFFDQDDKVTFQNTYADRDLTIPNTNPLILDAIGSAPPIYMLDEPYYIEIFDKFNNLIATLDNYLPSGEEITPGTELPIENLLPNYGFDIKLNENIFSASSVPQNSLTAVTFGWFLQINTTQTDPNNTYRYLELANSGLIGNPKNELILKSTNNTGGQTVNDLYTILGSYNMFQDQQLVFSIFTRRISGTSDTLPVELVRTKNGVPQTPISIGSISITGTQAQQTLVFTVPDLTTADFANNDELRLVINLPLNEDFEYGLTGTWCQLSPSGEIAISETAISTSIVKEWVGNQPGIFAQDNQFEQRGLPTAIGVDGFLVLPMTAGIFQGLTNPDNYSAFAGDMVNINNLSDGVELIRDEIIGNTQANRLIPELRSNGLTQSRLTFLASSATNVVTVQSGIGATENSTWQTSAAPRITVSKTQDELIYALSARCLGNGLMRFTFTQNFDASGTAAFNPVYGGSGPLVGSNVYGGGLPPPGAIINWIGTSRFDGTNPDQIFTPYVNRNIIDNGSGSTPAIVDINFIGNDSFSSKVTNWEIDAVLPQVQVYSVEWMLPYVGFTGQRRNWKDNGTNDIVTSQIQDGFLSYNDPADPPTQGVIPPRVIRFSTTAPTGSTSTATVGLNQTDTPETVCRRISETINTSWTHEITIVSTPTNADIVEISNSQTDFNLIFFDTALTKPTNPSTIRKAIFVEFTTAQTTTQIAASTASALNLGVMGIPRAADLGLRFAQALSYYMYF